MNYLDKYFSERGMMKLDSPPCWVDDFCEYHVGKYDSCDSHYLTKFNIELHREIIYTVPLLGEENFLSLMKLVE